MKDKESETCIPNKKCSFFYSTNLRFDIIEKFSTNNIRCLKQMLWKVGAFSTTKVREGLYGNKKA